MSFRLRNIYEIHVSHLHVGPVAAGVVGEENAAILSVRRHGQHRLAHGVNRTR